MPICCVIAFAIYSIYYDFGCNSQGIAPPSDEQRELLHSCFYQRADLSRSRFFDWDKDSGCFRWPSDNRTGLSDHCWSCNTRWHREIFSPKKTAMIIPDDAPQNLRWWVSAILAFKLFLRSYTQPAECFPNREICRIWSRNQIRPFSIQPRKRYTLILTARSVLTELTAKSKVFSTIYFHFSIAYKAETFNNKNLF